MRYHEDRYPDFYLERLNGWEKYCHGRAKNITWHKKPTKQEAEGHTRIFYWRDWEGSKKEYVFRDDCRFKNWQKSRLNYRTLPQFYDKGSRFVKIEKEFPVGFNWRWRPISLAEVRAIAAYEAELILQKKLEKKKKEAEEAN